MSRRRRPAPRPARPPARGAAKGAVYRQRRFPPLPLRVKLALALGWLAVVAVGVLVLPGWRARLAVALVALAALPLIVVLTRDPSRRTR